MDRRYSTNHIFMAIGACIFLTSPIFLLVIPLIVVSTIYYDRNAWVTYVPSVNYLIFGIGLFFLILACVLIWLLDVKKLTISLGIICVFLSGYMFYGASLSYVTITDEEIVYRKPFSQEKHLYEWDELDKLLYYEKLPEDDGLSYYEFYFKDKKMLSIKQNGPVASIQSSLSWKARDLDIPYIYVEE